ncbi:hypothetical protein MKW98_032040 [Papaver atlanticum]|uniref:Uncharacterized protein n=1 Tax=Papaver atlanticum TaxID=357466 RepID=A0AAD4SH05_9MAGN|nr:hypothetical protein MKW98_032040 [Papaver atlanticum]
MDREEKRRKLQEMVLKKLYPSSDEQPNPSKHHQIHLQKTDYKYGIEKQVYLNMSNEGLDDFEPEEKSASDANDSTSEMKLTRAQRKRLRKKKLKETASRPRNKIIGPMLLPSGETVASEEYDETDTVSRDARVLDDAIDKPGSGEKRNTQKKLK